MRPVGHYPRGRSVDGKEDRRRERVGAAGHMMHNVDVVFVRLMWIVYSTCGALLTAYRGQRRRVTSCE
jgi:hypothetical protein